MAMPAESENETIKPLSYGIFKGKIKVPENFDDPLAEFEDYM